MLYRIATDKKVEVEQHKDIVPIETLDERVVQQRPPLDLADALGGDGIKVIAEVKRASPSLGKFSDADPLALAMAYVRGGAAALSVLTDEKYFRGSLDHLAAIREKVNIPLLRKDFIVDSYQVFEARAYGADALLLIVAALTQDQLKRLLTLSHILGMRCLVEVHTEVEVKRALDVDARIIGINSRDLNTFVTDMDVVRRLRPLIPKDRIIVGESGIKNRQDVEKLRAHGINAVLVGEALVTAPDIPKKMAELMA